MTETTMNRLISPNFFGINWMHFYIISVSHNNSLHTTVYFNDLN